MSYEYQSKQDQYIVSICDLLEIFVDFVNDAKNNNPFRRFSADRISHSLNRCENLLDLIDYNSTEHQECVEYYFQHIKSNIKTLLDNETYETVNSFAKQAAIGNADSTLTNLIEIL